MKAERNSLLLCSFVFLYLRSPTRNGCRLARVVAGPRPDAMFDYDHEHRWR